MDISKPVQSARVFARLAVLQVLVSLTGQAQCINQWLPGEPNFNAPGSRSFIEWDPDGAGPLPKVLAFAAGNDVTIWDGAQFSKLGTGLFDVRALAVYNGSLIAATRCPQFANGGVYRWTGTYWETLGLGMGGVSNAYVQQLMPFQGRLIAAGGFFTADTGSASCVASWDGLRWSPIGAGLNNSVWALAEYQGELIAAGTFANTGGFPIAKIARWDGSFWQSMGDGLDNYVYSLAVQGTDLYASGTFTASGTLVSANRVARWDGTQWLGLGTGLNGQGTIVMPDGGGVIVGGTFTMAGTATVSNLARWDGQAWSAWTPGVNGEVQGMLRTADHLYISGAFSQTQGRTIGHTATWDGQQLRRMTGGFSNAVSSLVTMNDDVVLGGDFTTYRDKIVSRVSRWSNGELESLGAAPCSPRTMAVWQNRLYIAGAGIQPLAPNTNDNIWVWDGVNWNPIVTSVNGTFSKLTVFRNELIAGGTFNLINGVTASAVARFDGTTWRGLAGGLAYTGSSTRSISDLAVHNDTLVAVGLFNYSPGVTGLLSRAMAKWDGTAWSGFADGATNDGFVNRILSLNGELYFAMGFTELNHVPIRGIARWTGSTFEQFGPQILSPMRNFSSFHGRMMVGGTDILPGPTHFDGLITWNGTQWEPLGGSIGPLETGAAWWTAVLNNQLFVSGDFLAVDGHESRWLARYEETLSPVIDSQPVPASSCNHHDAQFAVHATGSSLGYRWEKNSVPIDLIENPSAGTMTLLISFPQAADSGQYACRISNDCGTVISRAAALTVCEGDFNCDATIDFFDYLDFVAAFAVADPGADFNADNVVDFFDYLDFVAAFSAGC